MTMIESQAKDWAIVISSRKGRETKAVVNVYHFDIESAEADNVRIKRFDTYSIEWLDYVVD